MSDHLKMERFSWFHEEVKRGAFPGLRNVMERFEVSKSTAKRLVAFMRERLHAPLEYDPARGGYRYTDDAFELPRVPVTQEELLALLLARHLLERSADGVIAERIRRFGEKLLADAAGSALDPERVAASFSAVWHGHAPAPAPVFEAAVRAVMDRRVLEIVYRSPASGAETRRGVEPHHLKHAMGSWFMVAWCRLRVGWRSFGLSRVAEARVSSEEFRPRPEAEWGHLVNDAFGVFQGDTHETAVLRFSPFRARWVREQVWHERQQIEERPDGGLILSFPVADYREVKMMILSFGPDVEVLEPAGLRKAVMRDIRRMGAVYGGGGAG